MAATRDEVLEVFFSLAGEAKRADDAYRDELPEAEYDAVLQWVLDNVGHRSALAGAFIDIVLDPGLGPLDLVEYSMHALRWDEVSRWLSERLEKEPSERARSVFRSVLESFDDDWKHADMYHRFVAVPWGKEGKRNH